MLRKNTANLIALLLLLPAVACAQQDRGSEAAGEGPVQGGAPVERTAEPQEGLAEATFAGGCFWCVEEAFDEVEGVVRTVSGYTGGHVSSPSYEQVSAGGTGHAEAVRVIYDPDVVGYEELLHHFWRNIDPLVENRQFCDVGRSYRSAIYYHGDEQRRLALATKERVDERFDAPVHTEIEPASEFWPAEEYHQDYYEKNPVRYRFYKWNCGRTSRLEELWGEEAGG